MNWTRTLAVGMVLSFAGGLFGQVAKLSPDVQALIANPQGAGQARVVVQFHQPGLLQTVLGLANLIPGTTEFVFDLVPAATKLIPIPLLSGLALNPTVEYVTLDRPIAGALATATDQAHAAVGAGIAASYGLTGRGVGVAVIDSGIGNHPDLASRVVYRESFVDNNSQDLYGHGTHVAGIVAGSGAASNGGVRGVAPGVNLIDLRVLDANGMSSDSVVLAAIDRASRLRTRYNIRVINLSLGRPIYESYEKDPLTRAVKAAWKNGMVVVVAAGNLGRNGYATILSPANAPEVITVGSMKTRDTLSKADDEIASYSSKGPTWGDMVVKPDLVAPGNLLVSLRVAGSRLDQEFPANVVDPYYTRLSGTSMAAPMVTGAAALMIERDPGLKPDVVKARLLKSAAKQFPLASVTVDSATGGVYPAAYDIYTVGAGYLDIPAALNSRETPVGSAASPWVVYNPLLGQGLLVNAKWSLWANADWGPTPVWGSRMVEPLAAAWGSSAVWGSNTIAGSAAAWGSTAAWGSSAAWGSAAAWGSTAAWGSAAAWGSSAVWGSSAAWGSSSVWSNSAAWGSTAAWGSSAAWGSTAAWGSSAAWGSNTNGTSEN